jgi:hypothetical protein
MPITVRFIDQIPSVYHHAAGAAVKIRIKFILPSFCRMHNVRSRLCKSIYQKTKAPRSTEGLVKRE